MPSPAPARNATILLVEDDPAIRDLYRRVLSASRYDVITAADGFSALTLIEERDPDVVVLDLQLPRVNGWDLYRELRQRWSTHRLPIIVVTGNELRDIPPADLAAFLQKPVDPFTLVAEVDRALRKPH